MRIWLLLLAFGALSAFGPIGARAEEDFEKELQRYQEDAAKVVRQIKERAAGMDTTKFSQARGRLMELALDDRFMASITDLWNHPKRNTLLVVDLIFLVVMFMVKAWRLDKARNWFTRMLLGMVFSFVTWVGVVLVIPWFVLGEPFRVVVTTLWRVMVRW